MGEPTVTLREYFETRLADLDARHLAILTAQERALTAALAANQSALDRINAQIDARFHGQDQYLSRATYEAAHETLRQQIDQVDTVLAEHKTWDATEFGRINEAIGGLKSRLAGTLAGMTAFVGIIAVLITVLELNR